MPETCPYCPSDQPIVAGVCPDCHRVSPFALDSGRRYRLVRLPTTQNAVRIMPWLNPPRLLALLGPKARVRAIVERIVPMRSGDTFQIRRAGLPRNHKEGRAPWYNIQARLDHGQQYHEGWLDGAALLGWQLKDVT